MTDSTPADHEPIATTTRVPPEESSESESPDAEPTDGSIATTTRVPR